MTRMTLAAHPLMVGFDQIERLAERAASRAADYPPFNIEHRAPDAFRVTLAVAGYAAEMLDVRLEDRQLVVRGRRPEAEDGAAPRTFLHRGIAARPFQRSFVLAEGVEVAGAHLANGLLTIDLTRRTAPEVVRTIPITRR